MDNVADSWNANRKRDTLPICKNNNGELFNRKQKLRRFTIKTQEEGHSVHSFNI